MVAKGELICPTFIVSTGQGYQLIWLLEPFKNIAGYTNDLDWRRIQDHMYEQLKELNSDSVVKNLVQLHGYQVQGITQQRI